MRARLKTRNGLLALGAGLVVLLAGGFAIAYFVVFPTSSPDKFSITAPATSGGATASSSTGTGNWVVASGSQAGYRVREKLAFLPAKNDAVGRTSAVSGSATIGGSAAARRITAAALRIDVSKLKSDRGMRDARIQGIGLQSATYPTATFTLTSPIALPKGAAGGKVVKVDATGDVTIHATKKRETIPLQLSLTGSALEAVGSLTFPWGEFGMTAPSVAGFVSVEPKATLEFDLHLKPR